jgi:hypothetical protein
MANSRYPKIRVIPICILLLVVLAVVIIVTLSVSPATKQQGDSVSSATPIYTPTPEPPIVHPDYWPFDGDTSKYTVAVRNGYGLVGSATSVSDLLAIAGYRQGEIDNANSYVYKETLIIYRDDSDHGAAYDIEKRLGYGRTVPNLDRYSFDGNILVIVGEEYSDSR